MSKQLYSSRYILKINSSKLRLNNWELELTLQDARDSEELISIGDSQLLRFIRDINGIGNKEEEIKELKKEIKNIKKEKSSLENKKKIKELYSQLDDILYVKDYVGVVFDNKADFDRATGKNGFKINNIKYKRLIGTTGGVKQNTVMFCNEDIHNELNRRLENGINKKIPMIPAKYEAYKALSASASTPVTFPKGILVIEDGITHIKDNVIKVYSDGDEGFKIDHNYEYEADKEFCDGCGMILPSLAKQWAIDLKLSHLDKDGNEVANYIPSGFNTRCFSNKGMLGTFDFIDFGENIAKEFIVKDVWGNNIDIRDVEIVLTTNMLKMWKCYDNIDDYINNCKKNGYDFCVAKTCPQELERKRNMNYQYLQSYEDMSDKDINELIKETLDNINGALGDDWVKAVLFSKGIHITKNEINKSDYDFIRALCIDNNILKDNFVKTKIYRMIEKRITDAKKGVIQVDGNYQIILGDLYALCESMFGMEIHGLLGRNEFYSRHWSDLGEDEIIAFRSPMTSHNNIKRMKLVDNRKLQHWYKYIDKCIIFNAWDTTTDTLNGCDFDSDAIITTNNKILKKNTKDELSIVCEQISVPKVEIKENLLKKANKNGFGSDIGQITNRVTAMYDVLASLEKDSKEYKELKDRIILGQAYQQEAIDKIKGIKAKTMPKEWYDYKINKYKDDDTRDIKRTKEKNRKIMVNKKPYFFIYNYKHIMHKYKQFIKNTEFNCMIRYGMSLQDLINKENKTKDEEMFIQNYKYTSPVFKNKSCMNRICFRIEEEYKNVKFKVKNNDNFDYTIYKAKDIEYKKADYNKINELFKEYKKDIANFKKKSPESDEKNNCNDRGLFINNFRIKASEICPNSKELCNIILDITYKTKNINSKQFAWDISGEQIIYNLLKRNDNTYRYPKLCDNGDIYYNGYKFKIEEVKVCEE